MGDPSSPVYRHPHVSGSRKTERPESHVEPDTVDESERAKEGHRDEGTRLMFDAFSGSTYTVTDSASTCTRKHAHMRTHTHNSSGLPHIPTSRTDHDEHCVPSDQRPANPSSTCSCWCRVSGAAAAVVAPSEARDAHS